VAEIKPAQYASLTAYLAHYLSLRGANSLSADERRMLDALRDPLSVLTPNELALLEQESTDSAARRHRNRAERKLHRELLARGAIAG